MSISEQAIGVHSELRKGLQRVRGLLKNRSTWEDSAAAARDAAAVLEQSVRQMDSICETAAAVEAELRSLRGDGDRSILECAELTAELAAVRAELEGWKHKHAALSKVEADLRAEQVRLHEEINGLATTLGTTRARARELLRGLPG